VEREFQDTSLGLHAFGRPDRVPVASATELTIVAFGGRTLASRPFVRSDLVAGASATSAKRDGVDVIGTDSRPYPGRLVLVAKIADGSERSRYAQSEAGTLRVDGWG